MSWRTLVHVLHRDLGYFFTGMVVLYAISGLAVNHVDDWNPNFVIARAEVRLDLPADPAAVTTELVLASLEPLGEVANYKAFDFPSAERIKIYLEDGSVTGLLGSGTGTHETIRRRAVLFEANHLHLNPGGWWRAFSDVFSLSLILIAVTGLFVLRGRKGLSGRGKWFVFAGIVAPVLAMLAV